MPCSSQCKVQDGRDCDITSGVCLGGCKHIDNPANTDWWLGDRCDDVFIRKFTYNLLLLCFTSNLIHIVLYSASCNV